MKGIVEMLYQRIEPRLDLPLEPESVLDLYLRRALSRFSEVEAYDIATLCGYLGNEHGAREWISIYRTLQKRREEYWTDTDIARNEFCDNLENWLDNGTFVEELEKVAIRERNKLGFAVPSK